MIKINTTMKKSLFIIVLLCCAEIIYGQSACEKTYNNAKSLYTRGEYEQAIKKFEAVKNNCDSYKEAADAYIKLCGANISLLDEKSDKNNLQNRYDRLNAKYNDLLKEKNKLVKDTIGRHNLQITAYNYKDLEKLNRRMRADLDDQDSLLQEYSKKNDSLQSTLKTIYYSLDKHVKKGLLSKEKSDIKVEDINEIKAIINNALDIKIESVETGTAIDTETFLKTTTDTKSDTETK